MFFVVSCLVLSAVAVHKPSVEIRTSLGEIVVQLDLVHAPRTCANFFRYVDAGRYVGGRFHRTVTLRNQPENKVKIQVIQGGVNPGYANQDFPPIKLERTNKTGLRHLNGTISMARDGADTATSDFFICIGAQPSLDYGGKRNPDGQGFAAFRRVTKGMSVVRGIQQSPSDGQNLTPPIAILSITRVSK